MIVGIAQIYRREKRKPRDVVEFLKKFPRRIYKFVPKKIYANGDGEIDGNFIDVRTELDLTKLRSTVK